MNFVEGLQLGVGIALGALIVGIPFVGIAYAWLKEKDSELGS